MIPNLQFGGFVNVLLVSRSAGFLETIGGHCGGSVKDRIAPPGSRSVFFFVFFFSPKCLSSTVYYIR